MLSRMISAVARVLQILYSTNSRRNSPLAFHQRNLEIIRRYKAGESQASIARAFGITYQRVYQIVRGRNH